jgi:hypothetical protein
MPMVNFIHSHGYRTYEFFVIPKLFILIYRYIYIYIYIYIYKIKYFPCLYVLILFILNIYYLNFDKQNLFIKKNW